MGTLPLNKEAATVYFKVSDPLHCITSGFTSLTRLIICFTIFNENFPSLAGTRSRLSALSTDKTSSSFLYSPAKVTECPNFISSALSSAAKSSAPEIGALLQFEELITFPGKKKKKKKC